ncbi:MAG TPA: S8 family serine peptidase [Saprospiraceae bacterium]|nr:S8 family serine peptidase [Saprospiraceae bacterium]HMQ84107.1 S8 family serine peptidase [Saprospiraceae bacterium]
MSKLTVKSGKGELTLNKSQQLVGLKTQDENIEAKSYIDQKLLNNLGGFNLVKLSKGDHDIDSALDEVREKNEIEVGTHVYFAEGSNKPLIPTGDIYITFADGVSMEEQQIVLEEYFLQLVERRSDELVLAKVTPKSPNPLKVAQALSQISLVKSAEPDIDTLLDEYEFREPLDDLLNQQWHLRNSGSVPGANYSLKRGADAKVIDAWSRLGNTGSDRVVVAIIDNGFDTNHPDLRTKVFRPFDLWNQSSNLTAGDPQFTHGTPCASVALAITNGKGIVGAAPNALFMPVSGTSFSNKTTEQMFDYCIEKGADIISCSWGTTEANFSLGAIKEAAIAKAARKGRNGKGCVILFAAGNDDLDYLNFYAAHPDVIAVGASTSQDQHASYSNRGRQLSIVAPSNGDWPILAARASWDQGISWENGLFKFYRDGRDRGSQYKHFGGTSSSTPLVAGICALILSANPDLTARQVKDILQKTADKIGSSSEYVNGHSVKYGYGRVNADKAVAEALRLRDEKQSTTVVTETSSTETTATTTAASGQGLFRFSVQRQASKGWGVQVGVYADYANVLIHAERYGAQFNQPIIVNINVLNGKTVYKVILGAFADFDAAKQLHERVKAAGISSFPTNLEKLG